MSTIESLNIQYINTKKVIDILQLYKNRILEEQNNSVQPIVKITKSLSHMENLSKEIDCTNYPQLTDMIVIGRQYIACFDAVKEYKSAFLQFDGGADRDSVLKVSESVISAQKEYDILKESYKQKYNYLIDSEEALNEGFSICIDKAIIAIKKQADKLKKEAKEIPGKELTVELHRDDEIQQSDTLPEKMLVARYPLKEKPMPILQDIGYTDTFQNFHVNLRRQGNVIVKAAYEQMEDESVDNFVLAYILRYIEIFPLGMVNIHIFDRNTNYFYKKLCDSFQTENAREITKKAVQIHKDMSELSILNDVNCEDIGRKISSRTPDLYSVYEYDKTDPFNLIILRDGFIDSSGSVSTEILEVIYSLSKIENTGHKCGIRFLIIDNSSSFEKNLSPVVKDQIDKIQRNCAFKLEYKDGNYMVEGTKVEILHIAGDLGIFIEMRSQYFADAMNSKERNYVSLDEVSANMVDEKLESIMYIPVGKTGNSIVELPFSCKDENGTTEGQCIGYMAIGQSGSGKSSFFHSLVLNGCIKYSPKDLQFWLLDFKNGGASSKYNNSGLPHIRMIAENNKIDDALCLFQMVLEEMERRNNIFNDNFVDNIVDYNKIAIEKGMEYFPRIIIAIDEVQEIFREDNASILQKLISSISTRMRSAGMHFVMVAQNLSEGKSYMLKDAFLPSVTGRICFRVASDVPRDSGFDDDFVERRREITELKTGEAYVGYGKNTIKRVKMAYVSSEEMNSRYFVNIRNKNSQYADMKPLVIGSRRRLTINSLLQGRKSTYFDAIKDVSAHNGIYTAIIGEDAYRMSPLKILFSQNKNSCVLFLGSDKQISSSLCTSIAVSLRRQNVSVHLFNGDKTKIQEGYESIPHSFMYVCQNICGYSTLMHNHKLKELKDVMRDIYSEYLERQALFQEADDEAPEFEPLFLIINDLLTIESFVSNEMIEGGESKESSEIRIGYYDILANKSDGRFNEGIQNVMETLVKSGWRYNIHIVLAINGSFDMRYSFRSIFEINNVVLFNMTEYADQFENSYYLKEMLKNISDDNGVETMAVWLNNKKYSKMRPVIYKMSEQREKNILEALVKGE